MERYQQLTIWKQGIAISKMIYQLTSTNKSLSTDFGLKDQLQRSSVSIPSNIAEGSMRGSHAEFMRYCRIARASLAELETQLIISTEIGYITKEDQDIALLFQTISVLHKQINSFITSLKEHT